MYRPDCHDKVKEIRENGIIGRDYLRGIISFEELEPIPLTPEILEKNGFIYDSEDQLFKDIYPRISMLYAQYRLVENYGINYGEMSEIKYVHQLQHALRLCFNHNFILHKALWVEKKQKKNRKNN